MPQYKPNQEIQGLTVLILLSRILLTCCVSVKITHKETQRSQTMLLLIMLFEISYCMTFHHLLNIDLTADLISENTLCTSVSIVPLLISICLFIAAI